MVEISCEIIKDLLPLYADKVASDDTARLVCEHIKHCPECRRFLAGCRRITHTADVSAVEDVHYADFSKKLRTRRTLKNSITGVMWTAALVATVLGVIGFIGSLAKNASGDIK